MTLHKSRATPGINLGANVVRPPSRWDLDSRASSKRENPSLNVIPLVIGGLALFRRRRMIADEIRYFFPLERRGTNLALGESSGNSWSDFFFFSSVSSETESVRSFPARWTRVRVHRSTGAFRRLLLLRAPIQSATAPTSHCEDFMKQHGDVKFSCNLNNSTGFV